MRERIRVLFLASDPFRDRAPLRLDEAVRAIDLALRKGSAHDGVELVAQFAPRTRDLQDALLRHDPQVVHFAGHGDDPALLYLGDEHGRPRPVGKEALGKLFGILGEWIKVVVLNGCDTLPTVEALGEVVDYVVGVNLPLTDAAALAFARAFYGALAMGCTVKESFERGIGQMTTEGSGESTLPVLRIRPGVDPAVPLAARPPDGAPPSPSGGGMGAAPARPRQGNTFHRFHGGRAPFEVLPGSTGEPRKTHLGDTFGDSFVFRPGRSR